jgi:hypothetical protein
VRREGRWTVPFDVRVRRITTAHPDIHTRRTTVYCLASRDTPGARCLSYHTEAITHDVISWEGGLTTKRAVELFMFLARHRTESDPPPDELMLDLFSGNRKMIKRVIKNLLVLSLQQAANPQGDPNDHDH